MSEGPLQIGRPAAGVAKAWNQGVHMAMSILPGPLRRSLGWYRWTDLLGGDYYGKVIRWKKYRPSYKLPAEVLFKRGIKPSPKVVPWPAVFTPLHCNWNWDNNWERVPAPEMAAWIQVWKAHPLGQACLDQALVGVAMSGNLRKAQALLDAGADPCASPPRGTLMERLWSAPLPSGQVWEIWKWVCEKGAIPSWSEWAKGNPRPERFTATEFERARLAGLSLPKGEAALAFAMAWVNDPPFGKLAGSRANALEGIEALRWLKKHGDLPPHAATVLLQKWLQTARPGSGAHYQRPLQLWLDELLSQGLPPRPSVGPRWRHTIHDKDDGPQPWSHWVACCPFMENLPLDKVEALCAEPDSWTAVNNRGQSTLELLECQVKEIERQQRSAERFKAWLGAHALEQTLGANMEEPAVGVRPRSRF